MPRSPRRPRDAVDYPTSPQFFALDRAGTYGADVYWVWEQNPYGRGYFAIEVPYDDKIWFARENQAREFCATQNKKFTDEAFKSVLIRWGIKTDEAIPEPEIDEPVIESKRHNYNLDIGLNPVFGIGGHR